ncbi:proline racemase family protein [Paremcibacter congregatus]|uniref:proline racemase family protein n=1 Tax=Paremcibacter congregatus TaxID=2043170 RepID=UPI003A8F1930
MSQPSSLHIIDMHTAGEPVRLLLPGQITLHGATLLEKRQDMKTRHDAIRRALMMEPRGHRDMYGAVLTEPADPQSDVAVLFMHHSGYSTMCGHATIALGRYLYDEHLKRHPDQPRHTFRIECPCGPVDVRVTEDANGNVVSAFDSVDCFVDGLDESIELDGLGHITYDIAYGGAYYAILPAARLGLDFLTTPVRQLADAANRITDHLRATRPIIHPHEEDLSFLYGTILTDDTPPVKDAISYNLCLFGDGQIDRSPTGSGVSARMALYHRKGLVTEASRPRFAGVSGIPFDARLCRSTKDSVAVRISGCGYYTGRSEMIIAPEDSLTYGFTLRNTFHDVMTSQKEI